MLLTPLITFVERLLPFERDYFLWLNHQRSDFLDTFMSIYSDKFTWIPLSLILLGVLLYKVEWRKIALFVFCGILIGLLCDMVPAELIKPFFGRLRPSHHPDFKDIVDVVLERRGGRFGFISNHAANGFGIAIFTSLLFKYRYYTITVYSWAIITAYSRIYLGVHFITDILGGFIWGTIVGILVYYLYIFFRKKILNQSPEELSKPLLSKTKAHIVMFGIFLTVIYAIIRGLFFQIG